MMMDQKSAATTNVGKFDKNVIYFKLIELAVATLIPGKRLVFFYHTDAKKHTEEADFDFLASLEDLDGFKLIDVSSCEFLKKRQRHMVTLEKLPLE